MPKPVASSAGAQTTASRAIPISAARPSPGSRTSSQAATVIVAKPTTGASQLHWRRPASHSAAAPTGSEAAITNSAAA